MIIYEQYLPGQNMGNIIKLFESLEKLKYDQCNLLFHNQMGKHQATYTDIFILLDYWTTLDMSCPVGRIRTFKCSKITITYLVQNYMHSINVLASGNYKTINLSLDQGMY